MDGVAPGGAGRLFVASCALSPGQVATHVRMSIKRIFIIVLHSPRRCPLF
jgi:hypothetical protein